MNYLRPGVPLLFSLLLAGVLPGCHLWDDYGATLPFDADAGEQSCPSAEPAPESLDPSSSSAGASATVCPDFARRWRLDLEAGMRLDARLTGFADEATVSIELFRAGADPRTDEPLEWPVWSANHVRVSDLITETGTYDLVVRTDKITPVELEVDLTAPLGGVYWIDAGAADGGDGTPSAPWNEWPTALQALQPGDLLIARPGSWTRRSSCDGLPEPCRVVEELLQSDCANGYNSGQPGLPITVAAERERQALLVDDGSQNAVLVEGCQHWKVEGLWLEGSDEDFNYGGHLARADDARFVEFNRLLLRHANRYRNTALISIVGSTDIVVSESEFYDYHRHGIIISSGSDILIERVYMNSRGEPDLSGHPTTWSEDDSRGDTGVFVWKGERVQVVNSIVENVRAGVAIAGNDGSGQEISVGDDSLFWGNVARKTMSGFHIASNPDACASPDDPDCVASGNRTENCVSIESEYAFRIAGGIDNAIVSSSAFQTGIQSENAAAFTLHVADSSNPELSPSQNLRIERSSSQGNLNAHGFVVASGIEDATIAHVNADGHDTPFVSDAVPASATTEASQFGACRVVVPASSPLDDVDGAPIGANIVYRHDGQAPTDQKLWDQRSGRFTCGAIVEGINDLDGVSCRDVHRRLNVGVDGCPVP